MTHRWWKYTGRPMTAVLALAASLGNLGSEAQAFQFNQGDLILAMFGNNQEYYRDLGAASNFLTSGTVTHVDLTTSLLNPLSATAGAGPVSWTLISGQGTTSTNTFVDVGSQFNTAQTIAAQTNQGIASTYSLLTGWNGFLAQTGPGTELVLASTNPASFTSQFGIGGTLGGSWTGGGMQGTFDSSLTMIEGHARVTGVGLNVLSDVGQAVLASSGRLDICGGAGCSVSAVPIPAAVVLFGSGLIGLAGIARRGRNA